MYCNYIAAFTPYHYMVPHMHCVHTVYTSTQESNPGNTVLNHAIIEQTYTQYYYQIHNQQIQQNKSAKYLGVVIDGHLTWKDYVNDIYSRAIKAKPFYNKIKPPLMSILCEI